MKSRYAEMQLSRAAIGTLPSELALDVVRTHCHLDSEEPPIAHDDALLTTYIKAAIEWFEGETRRTVLARSHRWVLACFPWGEYGRIVLPCGKTQSVSSIVYSTAHIETSLVGPSASPSGADFQEDLAADSGGVLMPLAGTFWPSVDVDVPAPVAITFIAGYASTFIPADIVQALLWFVSDCVEMRGTADVNQGTFSSVREHRLSRHVLRRW